MNHDSQLVKRLKSFVWRFGAYIVVASLAWLGSNIGLLELPPAVTALIAFIIGEITKAVREHSLYNDTRVDL